MMEKGEDLGTKGKWVLMGRKWHCSECWRPRLGAVRAPYCAFCGARMEISE